MGSRRGPRVYKGIFFFNKMVLGKRKRSGLSVVTAPGRRMVRTFRKRVARRGYRRSKRGVLPNYSFHRWIKVFSLPNVTDCTYDTGSSVLSTTVGTTASSFSLAFAMADVPSLTEFTTLFDSYMITGVMLQIKMINNPNAIGDKLPGGVNFNKNNFYPTIWYAPDHDDKNNATLDAIKEFQRVRHKVLLPNREVNIMLRPTTLQQVFRTALSTGYAENQKRQWLDIAQTDIPHYGFKCVIDMENVTTTEPFQFKINAKYYFKCKNVR